MTHLARDFVREDAQRRGLRQLASADDAVLHQIYLAPGGLPVALSCAGEVAKLVLGQDSE